MPLKLVRVLLITIFMLSLNYSTAFGQVYNIGYRVYDFPDEHGRVLTVAVWYPTNAQPNYFRYYLGNRSIITKVAVNAPVFKGNTPYPLVVFSHGAGGSGLQSPFLTEKLASLGYVVVAVDHEDEVILARIKGRVYNDKEKVREFIRWAVIHSNKWKTGRFSQEEHSYRFNDVKKAIDQMLALNNNPSSPFYQTIDAGKIGMCGHSFGGFTTMVVSGAFPRYRDSRIRAAICYSGPVEKAYSPAELMQIKIPIMLMAGEREKDRLEGAKEQYHYFKAPRFVLGIRGAKHIDFALTNYMSFYPTVQECHQDPRISVIVRYSTAFFNRYLKKDVFYENILQQNDPMLVFYQKEF